MDAQSIVLFFKDVITIYCHKMYGYDYPKPLASYIEQLEKDLKYEANSKALNRDRAYWKEVIESIYTTFRVSRVCSSRERKAATRTCVPQSMTA